MKKIKVNEDICISCGACVAICNEVFEFNDDMKASTIDGNNDLDKMDDNTKDDALDALEGCPVSAIFEESEENN